MVYNGGVNRKEAKEHALMEFPHTPLELHRRLWMVNAMGVFPFSLEIFAQIDSSTIRRTIGLGTMAGARYFMDFRRTQRNRAALTQGVDHTDDANLQNVDPPKPDFIARAAAVATIIAPPIGVCHASVDIFRAHSYGVQRKRLLRQHQLQEGNE